MVKPDVGAGSIGVQIVSDSSQACEAVENITNTLEFFGAQPACAIAQEYVQGHEYVVDTFAQQWQHHVMAVCVYRKHLSSTGAMVYDSLEWLDERSTGLFGLTRYVFTCLDILEHRHGSVHSEIIIDAQGPGLIDLGVRPHGAGHPMKTFALTGDSQLHAEVRFAKNRKLPRHYRLSKSAAISF